MVEYSAGGRGEWNAEKALEAVVKGRAPWKRTIGAFIGSSPGILGGYLLVREARVPMLIREAPRTPRPVNVCIESKSHSIWCLHLAKAARVLQTGDSG